MTTIATFTKTETGYIGEIHTLALKSTLTLSPADNTNAPVIKSSSAVVQAPMKQPSRFTSDVSLTGTTLSGEG